jgi:hypothetical protein
MGPVVMRGISDQIEANSGPMRRCRHKLWFQTMICVLVALTPQAFAAGFTISWFDSGAGNKALLNLTSGAAEFSETRAPAQGLIDARAAHSRGFRIATPATASSLCTSACFLIFVCGDLGATDMRAATDAGPQKNAAADRVEKIYNGFAVGTDAEGNEGYNAAQEAEEQLRLDFLSSFQNPRKNAANQTAWDQEEGQLISDSLKYGGDRTLDATAMYWGETHLHLPVTSPQELLAQAKTVQLSDQPGEREFAEYMANYLTARFDSLNRLATYYHSATDDIEGRNVALNLADLQAELRIDEVDRTLQARLTVRPGC